MQIEICISGKLIKPFDENEETSYKLAWKGTLKQLKIDSTNDDKISEVVYFKLNSERPADYPNDVITFSIGDVALLEARAYQCLAEGWRRFDNFAARKENQAVML